MALHGHVKKAGRRVVRSVKSAVRATGRRLTEAPELHELARRVRKAKGPLGKRGK